MNDRQHGHWLNLALAYLPCFIRYLSTVNSSSSSHRLCIDTPAAILPPYSWPGAHCTLICVQGWKLLLTVKHSTKTSVLLFYLQGPPALNSAPPPFFFYPDFHLVMFFLIPSVSSNFDNSQEPSRIFSRVSPIGVYRWFKQVMEDMLLNGEHSKRVQGVKCDCSLALLLSTWEW